MVYQSIDHDIRETRISIVQVLGHLTRSTLYSESYHYLSKASTYMKTFVSDIKNDSAGKSTVTLKMLCRDVRLLKATAYLRLKTALAASELRRNNEALEAAQDAVHTANSSVLALISIALEYGGYLLNAKSSLISKQCHTDQSPLPSKHDFKTVGNTAWMTLANIKHFDRTKSGSVSAFSSLKKTYLYQFRQRMISHHDNDIHRELDRIIKLIPILMQLKSVISSHDANM